MSGDTYPCGTPKSGAKGAERASGESNDDVQKKLLSGRQVEPIRLKGNENLADLIDNCFAGSGFNARRLAEACELYSHMLTKGATVGLTLSGAMTPIGMQGVLISLMEAGFIDWIISTGANLYHDLHRAFDCPVAQGHWATDDNELADVGVARIYDTYIGEDSTLMATDKVIIDAARTIAPGEPISTARFHKELGKELARHAPHPEKSMLIAAEKLGVPIYTSSPGDSSIGMNLVVPQLMGKPILLDPVRDVIETAALVRAAEENGVIHVGGGSPKNFYLQTQPTLHQILFDDVGGGHDYFIQLTTDSPHWGGLSGATPSEARSWGKIADANLNNVVVYSCASLTLPLLAQYVLIRNKPRALKKLLGTVDVAVEELREHAMKNPELKTSLS
ncbi:MAG: deoxyhypusine synthase [Planctomycetia bacterium]|nr:deoxyhypusine synthase [Planctomycetia bacterium]